VGTEVDAMEPGLVAGGEGEGAGFVGKSAEGEREIDTGIVGVQLGIRALADELAIDESRFDGPDALDAPAAATISSTRSASAAVAGR
jgi:hypothetical protein